MKIESLEKYKGSSYEVGFDDGTKLYMHIDIITDFGLNVGDDIDKERLNKAVYASNRRRAYQYALYLLDYRDYSYREMFKKLDKTYDNEDLCFEVMDKLVSVGLINDKRYAALLAKRYVEIKHFGMYRARNEMRQRGIFGNIAEEALMPYYDAIYENAKELIEKKYSRYLTDKTDRKSIDKVKNALVRYGYSYDEVNRTINEYFDDAEQEGLL